MKTASIRTYLLMLVLAMSVPLVAVIGFGIYSDMQHTIASTKSSLRALANSMVSNTSSKIRSARRIAESVAERPLVRQLDRRNCDGILKDLQSMEPGYANIGYSNVEGLVICSAAPLPEGKPVNLGKAPWFQNFMKEKRFTVGQPIIGPITGKWVAVLSTPIRDEHQQMIGVVNLPLDLNSLDPNIPDQLLPAQSRYGFFDADGIMIWRNLDPEGVIGTRPNADAARRIVEVRDGEFESLAIDGVTRYFSVVPMPETGWIAFVGVPAAEVYATAKRRATISSAIALAVIAVLIFFATIIARRIATPIAAMEKSARAVHNGNLEVRAGVAGPREVAAVAVEFNAMIEAQQLGNAQLRVAAAAFESHQGIVVTDTNDVILRINRMFTEITGYGAGEAIGRRMNILKSDRHDADFYAEMWNKILNDGVWEGEIWNRLKNGEVRPHWLIISAVKDDGNVTHYVGTYTDISERKQMEEQVRQLAFYDTLTNLPNRRLINDRLSQIMATSKRTGCYGAVLFLDLDNFKPLNDAHGHEVGDLLLIEAADRLRNCVREMDTVGRFGGDEFVVILAELNASQDASTTQARIVADKICSSLSAPYQLSLRDAGKADTIEHRCTASIGVALFIDHHASQDDVLRWADAAMYQAKDAGRNSIRFHGMT
ncbi:MAG: diguanylate cyclase [Proteobacteria bacterium]|nr:diguanylate cyclase [Pseudomonadota bacterium]